MKVNLETLLPWTNPKRTQTTYGLRDLRTAPATPEFWKLWRDDKPALKEAGISCKPKNGDPNGEWLVCWWQPIPEAEQAKRAEAVDASRATDAEAELIAPEGLNYLPYQRAGIAYALQREGTLIADEMGLGKTIQAIGVINNNPKIDRVCIICPASLKLNWKIELTKWLTRSMTVGIADGKHFPTEQIVIINFDVVHKWEKRLTFFWDLLIVDECHYLKNRRARRTKFILGVKPSRKEVDEHVHGQIEPQRDKFNALAAKEREQFVKQCQQYAREQLSKSSIPARKRVFLTGTPICNEPMEIFPLISALDPERWGNFFAFAKRYAGATQTQFGWDMSGATNLEELQVELRASCMIRRLKMDVLKELPPKRRQVIELPSEGMACVKAEQEAQDAMEDKLAKLYAAVELCKASEDVAAYEKAVDMLNEGINVNFAEVSRLRHETAVAKIPMMIEAVTDAIEESGKIVLFAHHKDVVDAFMEAFPCAVKVVGGMTPEQKQASVVRFQNDPTCKLFVGSIMAAGVGLTLTASSHVIFAELDWVPGNVSQAEDRTHRIGQTQSVLVQHYVLAGSIDAKMVKTILAKQQIIDRALNDVTRAAQDITSGVTEVTIRERIEGKEAPKSERSVSATVSELERVAKLLTQDQIEAVHRGVQIIAGFCDRAEKLDGSGFSKIDVNIGHSLAEAAMLSARQAALGRKLCIKYQRQLPAALVEAVKEVKK